MAKDWCNLVRPVPQGGKTTLVWATDVPFGRSSPVIAGDRVFPTALDDGALVTLALDLESGEELWRKKVERRFQMSGNGNLKKREVARMDYTEGKLGIGVVEEETLSDARYNRALAVREVRDRGQGGVSGVRLEQVP